MTQALAVCRPGLPLQTRYALAHIPYDAAAGSALTAPHLCSQGANSSSSIGSVRVGGWCVSVASLVPMLAHVVVASSCAVSSQCQATPQHYHEEASALPWSSLLLVAAAVTNPLLYVFTDDQVRLRPRLKQVSESSLLSSLVGL